MTLSPDDLHHIAARTLAHYDRRAADYWEGTRDRDVSQNINALLDHIDAPPPFDLLDLGCGPGRDLRTFKSLGHRAVGLDGSPQLAEMARMGRTHKFEDRPRFDSNRCIAVIGSRPRGRTVRPFAATFPTNMAGDHEELQEDLVQDRLAASNWLPRPIEPRRSASARAAAS